MRGYEFCYYVGIDAAIKKYKEKAITFQELMS